MTGEELVSFIQANQLEDWDIEVKVHGIVVRIVDAVRKEGMIRLYPKEDEE